MDNIAQTIIPMVGCHIRQNSSQTKQMSKDGFNTQADINSKTLKCYIVHSFFSIQTMTALLTATQMILQF